MLFGVLEKHGLAFTESMQNFVERADHKRMTATFFPALALGKYFWWGPWNHQSIPGAIVICSFHRIFRTYCSFFAVFISTICIPPDHFGHHTVAYRKPIFHTAHFFTSTLVVWYCSFSNLMVCPKFSILNCWLS